MRRLRRNDIAAGKTEFLLSEDGLNIRELLRDGVTQVENVDFTFTEPKKITLTGGGAAVAGEQFIIEFDTQILDEDIDLAIRHAKEDFRDELSHILSDEQLAEFEIVTPDQVTEKAMALAVLYCEQIVLKGNKIFGNERDANRMDIMKAKKDMKLYRTGEKKLIGIEVDMKSRLAVGHGGNLILTNQPTQDEMFDLSLKIDRKEDAAF